MNSELFHFTWNMIPKTRLSAIDFIVPTSFDFRLGRLFRTVSTWGAVSYMLFMALELFFKLLEMDAEMTMTPQSPEPYKK